MVLRSDLIEKAKVMGLKGCSRMKKRDLEWLIQIKEANNWFNNLIDESEKNDGIYIGKKIHDVDLNIIDLNEDITKLTKEKLAKAREKAKARKNMAMQKLESNDFKLWDIPLEKQKWLLDIK